jgi:hypothetical protein
MNVEDTGNAIFAAVAGMHIQVSPHCHNPATLPKVLAMKNSFVNPAPPETVSFRLPKETATELAAKAARAGVSPNLLARDLMTAALLEPPDEYRRSLELILAELGRLKTALSATNGPRREEDFSSRLLAEFHKMLTSYFNRHEQNSQQDLDTLRSEIAEVLCNLPQIQRLDEKLADSVLVLLMNAGKVSREQAEAWVQDRFLEPAD